MFSFTVCIVMALYRIALITFLSSLSYYSAAIISQSSIPAFTASTVMAAAEPATDPTWQSGTVDYLEIPANVGGDSRPIRSLAFTPDGQFLVSGGANKTIKIWNIETRSLVQTLRPSPAQEV